MAIKSRILYIEDDPALGRLIQTYLVNAGYDVTLATDGADGLAKFDELHFDVLAVDNSMPVYDGVEIIRILASKGALIPTIMVTGSGDEHTAVEALKLGAMDYIVKDIHGSFIQLLPSVIEKVRRQRRLLDEKRNMEHALFESEERYRTLFATLSDAIFVIEKESLRFVDVNPAAQALYGYSRDEFIGMSVLQISAEPDRTLAAIRNVDEQHIPIRYHRTKDGAIFPVEISVARCTLLGREIIIGAVRDISTRLETEQELREKQHYLSKILDSSPNMIYIFDLDDRKLTLINKETTNMLGYAPEFLLNAGSDVDAMIIHPDDIDQVFKNYAKFDSMPDGTALDCEFRMRHIDGTYRWVTARETVFTRHADATPRSILGALQDITEKKKITEAIREREQTLGLITDNMHDMVGKVDMNGIFQYVSPSHKTQLGYDPEQLLGTPSLDHVHPDDVPRCMEMFDPERETSFSRRLEYRFRNAQGKYRWLESSSNFVYDEQGTPNGAIVSSRDITAEREMRVALLENEEKFRKLTSGALDAIVLADNTGKIRFWNEAAQKIFGYTVEEAKTISIEKILSPDHNASGASDLLRNFRNENREDLPGLIAEFTAVNKDGIAFPVEVSISTMMLHGSWHVIAIIRDISDRKETEHALVRHTEELRESNQELDAFAHTVAHDLKNPINAMVGLVDLLGMEFGDTVTNDTKDILRMLEQSVRKMIGIIDSLLLLSSVRKGSLRPEKMDMKVIVEETLVRVEPYGMQYGARITAAIDAPPVMGYTPWVEEAWMNYIMNGLKYGGRPPVLELGNDPPANGFVHFWVRDNGEGITPEQQETLFQPFSRLHQAKIEGHGLGLSIVRRIIERLGGKVTVESAAGQGSRFGFTLPVVRT